MSEHDRDRQLQRRVVDALERQTETLDPALRRRLDRARRRALAQPDRRRGPWFVWPALATAAAAALAAVVVLIGPQGESSPGIPALPASDDMDLLTLQEFELFVEDPEFYAWVAGTGAQQQVRERAGKREDST